MAFSVEDILNIALSRVGYATPIGTIYEGSPASRAAVEFYVHERDELTVAEDWQFARQEISLGFPLKTAPVSGYSPMTPWTSAYPLLPWIYEYPYPADCLKIRSLRPQPALIPVFKPVPNVFTIANDPTVAIRVVLTNLLSPVACITAPIADPAQWSPEPRFTEALVQRLARRFQEKLAPKPDEVKERMIEELPTPIVDSRG